MDSQEYFTWCKNVDKAFYGEILLDRLKKAGKINKKKEKEIKKRIKKLTYATLLKSPHLENNEELRRRTFILCFKDYFPDISSTKSFSVS